MSTFDGLFYNTKLEKMFPLASSIFLPGFGSDHTPIVRDYGIGFYPKSTTYRFEKWLFLGEDFKPLIEKTWKEPTEANLLLIDGRTKLGDSGKLLRGGALTLSLKLGRLKKEPYG